MLSNALEAALKGSPRSLYDLLARASGLPGARANMGIVQAFAEECALRGASTDRLVVTMATLDADSAPGGTELEILPMCGVAALGARAARDEGVLDRALLTLHDAADDLRFRVRECVPVALARIGGAMGDALVERVRGWMDGYFHAAAVLLALADTNWLSRLSRPDTVLDRLEEAFALAANAERSAARYPGYKALVDALSSVPASVAARFGVPVFDRMVVWSASQNPTLRDAVEANLAGSRLQGRFAPEIARVRAELARTAPVRRDADRVVRGTRGRGRRGRG
jgi:hypothetical protein